MGQCLRFGFWPVAIVSGVEARISQCSHAQAEKGRQKLCCYDGYQGPGDVGPNLGCNKAKKYPTGRTYYENRAKEALPVCACKSQKWYFDDYGVKASLQPGFRHCRQRGGEHFQHSRLSPMTKAPWKKAKCSPALSPRRRLTLFCSFASPVWVGISAPVRPGAGA